jgi:hypothetical protein
MNNLISRRMKWERAENEAYKKAHPEIAPIADKIQQFARECPDRTKKFPTLLEYDDAHIKRCHKCIKRLADMGIVYPKA